MMEKFCPSKSEAKDRDAIETAKLESLSQVNKVDSRPSKRNNATRKQEQMLV